ncbi:hypothetical protein IEO21_01324 [Rhodonia placenta]|uniref:Uncharacterized protein n=1 Tax=Rhodonia placenta TaxID=104341 RepID=A0A8H7U5Z8_9APHY|nr:hypothetical protein IEO21_01324 [Postia placenta]
MTSHDCAPCPPLPVELVEQIIEQAWSSPMTREQRSTLFLTFCHINRTWLSLFIHIALRDVHIGCPLSSEDYLRLLRERRPSDPNNDFELESASTTANALCRSLTFRVGHDTHLPIPNAEPSVLLYSIDNPSANAISSTLYMVSTLNYLPNLRRVSIEYVNWGFEDIPEQGRLLAFPDQVTDLHITFAFTKPALVRLADTLRTRYSRRWYAGGDTPSIRRLSVFGAPMDFVAEMIETCPNVETVDLDGSGGLDALLHIPESLHTLNLHMSSSTLGEAEIGKWRLDAALNMGLLKSPRTMQRRLVFHSGAPDATAWEKARKLCADHNVVLVHKLL